MSTDTIVGATVSAVSTTAILTDELVLIRLPPVLQKNAGVIRQTRRVERQKGNARKSEGKNKKICQYKPYQSEVLQKTHKQTHQIQNTENTQKITHSYQNTQQQYREHINIHKKHTQETHTRNTHKKHTQKHIKHTANTHTKLQSMYPVE